MLYTAKVTGAETGFSLEDKQVFLSVFETG